MNMFGGSEDRKQDIGVSSEHLDTPENIQKFEKYHADYARYLNAKYFSGKNLYGGNIYEKEVRIDNVTIKASRWPCTRSFTDPVQSFQDHINLPNCPPKAPMSVPNRKKCSNALQSPVRFSVSEDRGELKGLEVQKEVHVMQDHVA